MEQQNVKYFTTTLYIHEPNVKGCYDTEPHIYEFKSEQKMTSDDFKSLMWQSVEIERFAEGIVLYVEVRTEYDGEYVDGDDYEVTIVKIVHTDELSPMIDWEKCSPKQPKIYTVNKELSKMEVKLQ